MHEIIHNPPDPMVAYHERALVAEAAKVRVHRAHFDACRARLLALRHDARITVATSNEIVADFDAAKHELDLALGFFFRAYEQLATAKASLVASVDAPAPIEVAA